MSQDEPDIAVESLDTKAPDLTATARSELIAPAPPATALTEERQFKRPPEQQAVWDNILKRLDKDLALTAGNTVDGALKPDLMRVEKGFEFKSEASDTDFSELHVGPLLDQASDLLDRCLRERTRWDDLSAKWVTFLMELHEYAELDKIHAEEEEKGVYDTPWQVSKASSAAERMSANLSEQQKDIVERARKVLFSKEEQNRQYNADRKTAWLVGLVAYFFGTQKFSGYIKHKWSGVPETVSHWSVDAAEAKSSHSLSSRNSSLAIQRNVFHASELTTKSRLPGAAAQAEWDSQNRMFLRRRTLVARRLQDIRVLSSTSPDGALNYGKRLEGMRTRFRRDFRDALARLKPAAEGLALLYGYKVALPKNTLSVDYYDNCLEWTRRAVQWLIRFSRAEQNVVVPISVRTVLGDQEWKEGLKKGRWSLTVDAKTPVIGPMLSALRHVRMRGLGAFVSGKKVSDSLWQLAVSLPPEAKVKHLNGDEVTIDQSRIPSCLLARVSERDSQREPDVVGLSALLNASPLGDSWTVELQGAMPPTGAKVEDVHLELHLAYRQA